MVSFGFDSPVWFWTFRSDFGCLRPISEYYVRFRKASSNLGRFRLISDSLVRFFRFRQRRWFLLFLKEFVRRFTNASISCNSNCCRIVRPISNCALRCWTHRPILDGFVRFLTGSRFFKRLYSVLEAYEQVVLISELFIWYWMLAYVFGLPTAFCLVVSISNGTSTFLFDFGGFRPIMCVWFAYKSFRQISDAFVQSQRFPLAFVLFGSIWDASVWFQVGPSDFHRLKVTALLKKMLKGACFSFRRPAVVYIGSIGKYPVYSIITLSFSIFH